MPVQPAQRPGVERVECFGVAPLYARRQAARCRQPNAGYHLRLEVLEAARFAHHVLPQQDREAIADFLDTLDANYNIGLSSFLLESLL